MRVLFSPIGLSDPFTETGDGPMLHIVRHFKPNKVVLFLSPRMAEHQKNDSRYTKGIELIAQEFDMEVPEIELITSNNENVHLYDSFVQEFEDILKQIANENPDAEIVVNTSSGTPAMGQALIVVHAFGRLKLRALQVAAPKKGQDNQTARLNQDVYDLNYAWELYCLNENRDEKRWIDVGSIHLNDLILRDNVRTLIENYDYVGASLLAAQNRTVSSEAKKLIDGCVSRMRLESSDAENRFRKTDFPYDETKKLQEYLNILEVYLKRRQWADYVRALTPALSETLHSCVKEKLSDKQWLKPGTNEIDRRKCRENERIVRAFQNANRYHRLQDGDKSPYALNTDYLCLIKELYPRNDARVKLCERLKKFEDKARHNLAHNISQVKKNLLEKEGRMKLEDVLAALHELNNTEGGLYSRINKTIINRLYQGNG